MVGQVGTTQMSGVSIVKGCLLLVNEFLWSLGMSMIAQCYSTRGLEVVAARNIASTYANTSSPVLNPIAGWNPNLTAPTAISGPTAL